MKATIFQDGKPVEIQLNTNDNARATFMLDNLVANGYISGFIMLLNKKEGNE